MHQFMSRLTLIAALIFAAACSAKPQVTANPAPAEVSSPPVPRRPATAAASSDSSWLQSDSAAKTATLDLTVTHPDTSPSALINGYRAGEVRVVVPMHWTVKWNWRNQDAGAAHSLVVMVQREKVPLEGGRAAFSNAMSGSVITGLGAGQTDQTTFEAEESGWYWLMCGVPSHALNGEWIELQVNPEARAATLQRKQR
jgi:sulfocyanin SoxE-like protein